MKQLFTMVILAVCIGCSPKTETTATLSNLVAYLKADQRDTYGISVLAWQDGRTDCEYLVFSKGNGGNIVVLPRTGTCSPKQ